MNWLTKACPLLRFKLYFIIKRALILSIRAELSLYLEKLFGITESGSKHSTKTVQKKIVTIM